MERLIEQITNEIFERLKKTEEGISTAPLKAKSGTGKYEYALLAPIAEVSAVKTAVAGALSKGVYSIAVPQWYVPVAKETAGSKLLVATRIGLPNGKSATQAKYAETKEAVRNGADILDITLNSAAIMSGNFTELQYDLDYVKIAAGSAKVNATIEWSLADGQKLSSILRTVQKSGYNGVLISHSLDGMKASPDEVRKIREFAPELEIKVAGGITDSAAASALIQAGADVICSSHALEF